MPAIARITSSIYPRICCNKSMPRPIGISGNCISWPATADCCKVSAPRMASLPASIRFMRVCSGPCISSDNKVTLQNTIQNVGMTVVVAMALVGSAGALKGSKAKTAPLPGPPELLLSGGRRLVYERTFSSQREVKLKKGFWTRLLDVVAGAPEYHDLVRPYSVAADSRGRLLTTY